MCLLWALSRKHIHGSALTVRGYKLQYVHAIVWQMLLFKTPWELWTKRKHVAQQDYRNVSHNFPVFEKQQCKMKLLLLSWQQNCGVLWWKESRWRLVFWLCLFIKGKNDSLSFLMKDGWGKLRRSTDLVSF